MVPYVHQMGPVFEVVLESALVIGEGWSFSHAECCGSLDLVVVVGWFLSVSVRILKDSIGLEEICSMALSILSWIDLNCVLFHL